jgi:hypothetical protein
MSNNEIPSLKGLVLVTLSLFSIVIMTIISVFFGYLNQSSDTPKDDQLTFLNYLLPYLLTVCFMVYFTISQIKTNKSRVKRNWVIISLVVFAAAIAIPWQIKHFIWQSKKETIQLFELLPYLIGMIFTLSTVIIELRRGFKSNPQQNV